MWLTPTALQCKEDKRIPIRVPRAPERPELAKEENIVGAMQPMLGSAWQALPTQTRPCRRPTSSARVSNTASPYGLNLAFTLPGPVWSGRAWSIGGSSPADAVARRRRETMASQRLPPRGPAFLPGVPPSSPGSPFWRSSTAAARSVGAGTFHSCIGRLATRPPMGRPRVVQCRLTPRRCLVSPSLPTRSHSKV